MQVLEKQKLDYLPLSLKPQVTIVVAIIFLFVSAGLYAVMRKGGQYTVSADYAYFIAHYGPSIGGTISTLVFQWISGDLFRLMPYMLMAEEGGTIGRFSLQAQFWNGFFAYGQTLFTRMIWFTAFLAGYVTAFKTGLLILHVSDGQYTISVNQFSGLVLAVLYLIMALACIAVAIWIRRKKSTGLKWDPSCLADIGAMFHESNARGQFQAAEPHGKHVKHHVLGDERYMLGHRRVQCSCSAGGVAVQYGIFSPDGSSSHEAPGDQSGSEVEHDLHFPGFEKNYRRWNYGMLVYTILFASVTVLAAYVLFHGYVESGFVVSNMLSCGQNGTCNGNETLTDSWNPDWFELWGVPWRDVGDDGEHDLWIYAFLTRVLPALVASAFAMGYLTGLLNSYARAQTLVEMYSGSATAERSILLQYLGGSIVYIISKAAECEHYKLLYIAILQLVSSSFPILVGGVFMLIINNGPTITFIISPLAFYAVSTFCLIYAISLPILWRTDRRRLFFPGWTLGHLMSLCWASRFLDYPEMNISRPDMTQNLFHARIVAKEYIMAYGHYRCVEGCLHPGFDALKVDGVAVGDVKTWNEDATGKKRTWWRKTYEPVKVEADALGGV